MQPIYIDVSDEITTVIERMKASSAESLALVVPRGAILLQSIVNLKLAKKAAADTGKTLTLVTTDKIGRNLASQVGINIVSRLDANGEVDIAAEELESGSEPHIIDGVKVHRYYENTAAEKAMPDDEPLSPEIEPIIPREIMQQKAAEEAALAEVDDDSPIVVREIKTDTIKAKTSTKSDPIIVPEAALLTTTISEAQIPVDNKTDKPKRSYRKVAMLSIYILILLLLGTGAVAAFYLPQTTITITSKAQPWSKDFSETAKVGASISPDGSTIPAELITAEVTDKQPFKSTGSKEVGETAKGTAQIFNGYSSTPQTLPAGTKLTANGLSFITQQEVTVPGAEVQSGKPVPGAATVNVVAAQPGADSNLSGVTGTISGSNLYCQIVSTTGGSSKQIAVITATDIANAKLALNKKIREAADAKIVEQLHDRDILFDDKADSYTLDDFLTTQLAGSEVSTAEVSGKGTVKRLIIDKATLKTATSKRVQDTQSKDNTYLLDTFEISNLQVKMAEQTATIATLSKGRFSPTIATDSIRSQLVGKNKDSGLALITLIVKDSTVKVVQTPAWWPNKNFPYSSRYLIVKVVYE